MVLLLQQGCEAPARVEMESQFRVLGYLAVLLGYLAPQSIHKHGRGFGIGEEYKGFGRRRIVHKGLDVAVLFFAFLPVPFQWGYVSSRTPSTKSSTSFSVLKKWSEARIPAG